MVKTPGASMVDSCATDPSLSVARCLWFGSELLTYPRHSGCEDLPCGIRMMERLAHHPFRTAQTKNRLSLTGGIHSKQT